MGFMTETAVPSSLAIFATLLILLSTATAEPDVNPFCTSASDKPLCTDMANGAKTWPEAMTNMVNAGIEKVQAGKPIAYGVGAKLPKELEPQTKKSIQKTCEEAYETLIFNLGECVGFIKHDPTHALKHYVSTVNFFDCKNAVEEFGVSLAEVTEFDVELIGIANALIAVVEKNSTYNN